MLMQIKEPILGIKNICLPDKNFKDYEFYIVWKDNLNKKQAYLDNLEIIERLFLYELHYSLKNNFIY